MLLPRPRCSVPTDLVVPSPLDVTGSTGPTPGRARGSGWRRCGPGWYVPADTSRRPEQRVLEASVRLPPGAAVTGWAACRLHGALYLDGLAEDGFTELPVPLALGTTQLRRTPEVVLLRDRLGDTEVITVAGIPCTMPERAVYDAARLASGLRPAVRVLDMACAAEITSLSRLDAYLATRRRVDPAVRAALEHACEESLSPREVDLRFIWTLDAGLSPPLVNHPVLDLTGRLIGVPDLFDPRTGHAVEYDGAEHRTRRRHTRDVDREADFRAAGCELTRVVAPHLHDIDRLVGRLHAGQERAAASPTRRWRLGTPGPPLDQRIAEREARGRLYRQWEDQTGA